jgi:anti-anti-sigma factor
VAAFQAVVDAERVVVFLPKSLDLETADLLKALVTDLLDHGFTKLVVDCSAVASCNSAGIGEIARSHVSCARASGSFALNRCQSPLRDLLRITSLDTVLAFVDVDYSKHKRQSISPGKLGPLKVRH